MLSIFLRIWAWRLSKLTHSLHQCTWYNIYTTHWREMLPCSRPSCMLSQNLISLYLNITQTLMHDIPLSLLISMLCSINFRRQNMLIFTKMNASTCKTTLKPELGNLALFKIESYTQFAMYIAISCCRRQLTNLDLGCYVLYPDLCTELCIVNEDLDL